MTKFTIVKNEVCTNSVLKEIKELLDKQIKAGEYPQKELTEDKIIQLLIGIMIKHEEKSRRRTPHSSRLDCYIYQKKI